MFKKSIFLVSATSKDPITSTYLPPQVSSITTEVKPVAEYDDEYYDNEYTSTPRSYTSITNQSTGKLKIILTTWVG